MNQHAFPALLVKRATFFGGLTRYDLAIFGGGLIVSSWLKVGGLFSLGVNIALLIAFKMVRQKLPRGFFLHLREARELNWNHQLKELHHEKASHLSHL